MTPEQEKKAAYNRTYQEKLKKRLEAGKKILEEKNEVLEEVKVPQKTKEDKKRYFKEYHDNHKKILEACTIKKISMV